MIDKFCESFLLRIRKRKDSYIQNIAMGSLNSMEDYKKICGKIQGIDECEEIIKVLFNDYFGETKLNNRENVHD